MRALLYTHTRKTQKSKCFPLFLWTEVQPVHTPVRTQAYGPALSQSNVSILSVFCLVCNKEFYSDLYKKEGVDTMLQNKVLKSLNTKLSNVDKAECDKILQKPEIFDALTELPLGKTPGLDGLPAEFYRTMWSFIKDYHHDHGRTGHSCSKMVQIQPDRLTGQF